MTGDRNYSDQKTLESRLDLLLEAEPNLTIVEGGAKGADTMAREWAKKNIVPYREYRASWDRFGKAAGPVRNQKMLDDNDIDLVLAFHQDIEKSKGTKDVVRRAEKQGITVEVIS